MKIRLMGSPDLVRAWGAPIAATVEASYAEYPCRGGSHEIRAYCDFDDRAAAAFAFTRTPKPPAAVPERNSRSKAKRLPPARRLDEEDFDG